jgi:iron complex outermembrane recepter protein
MNPLNRRATPLVAALAVAFGGGLATQIAFAQQAPAAQASAQKQERIEVTGSRIKRSDSEAAVPVQVISRQDIEKSGATTVAEVLKNVPATNSGSFNESAVASFTPGAASASLRGLGGSATLVLINGRRIAPYGFASGGQSTFVDINAIPIDAIERIEVLLDGASAVYGSEAMAGVINVIMRKDFQGLTLNGSLASSSRNDAHSANLGIAGGIGSLASDRYNLFGAVSFRTQDSLKGRERPATRDSDFRRLGSIDRRSTYAFPGNAYTGTGLNQTFVGTLPGCNPIVDASSPAVNGRCVYEFADHIDLVPESERLTGFVSGVVDLGGSWQAFGDLSLTRNTFEQSSASYNVSTYGYAVAVLPAAHPQNTFGRDVGVRYRLSDVPLSIGAESNTLRFVGGARGDLAGWDAEAAVLHSKSNTDVIYKGFTRDRVLENEFFVPGTNRVQNNVRLGALSADLRARLYPELLNTGDTAVTSIDIKVSRELAQLGGGGLGLALGLDARTEKFTSTPDALSAAGEIGALGASSAAGSRRVSAAFVELSAPFFRGFEAQFAGRYDRYSDFGGKFSPKLAVKWKPLSNLALRGSYSEGFRAPSLTETSSTPTRGFYTNVRDPRLCPVPDANNANCALSIEGYSGANPNLLPETSKGFVFGMVFDPTDDLSVSLDFYNIKRKNEISSLDVEYLLANENLYPRYVTRDAAGAITRLDLPYENLGSTQVKGVDLDVKGRIGLGANGRVNYGVTYNYMPTYNVKPVATAPELNYAGTWQQPKERIRFSLGWEGGNWDVTGTWNYVSSYLRAFTPSDLTCSLTAAQIAAGQCRIQSWNTTDVVVRYRGIRNLELSLAINNIEDRMAPLDQRRETRFTWYTPTYHNPLGRMMRVGARYKF